MATREAHPAVSVIMPLYNKKQTVERTIRSIYAQTLKNFELIIVDDESTDGSAQIVQRLADSRTRIIRQKNAGPAVARNRGMRESRSSLVTFLDADDEWLPDFLERAVRWMEENPQCHVACGGRFWDPGRIDREGHNRRIGVDEAPWRLSPNASPRQIREQVEFLFSGSAIARKETLLRYGGYCEEPGAFPEDTYMWLQVCLNHEIYRDPKAVMIWHREGSDISHGRKRRYPVPPMLLYPEPLRRNCPAAYRKALEDYLSYYAVLVAKRHLRYGDGQTIRWLFRTFPAIAGHRIERVILWALSFLSPLIRLARSIPGATRVARRLFGVHYLVKDSAAMAPEH